MKSTKRMAACMAVCAALLAGGVTQVRAGDRDPGFGRADRGEALALGDSIVFGYIAGANPQYVNAANFQGWPDYLSESLDLNFTNASCPGETSAHLLSLAGRDYKCGGFRAGFPLHARYQTSQLDFARQFLATTARVRLVAIGIGANDVFALQEDCRNDLVCVGANLPTVLNQLAQNLGTLLVQLRGTGYAGPIVIATYYSPDFADPNLTQLTGALNQVLAGVATAYGATVADVFAAFRKAATMPAGGTLCGTGLLNVEPGSVVGQTPTAMRCDFHPSLSGQRLIAQTIAWSLPRAGR